MGKVNQWYKLKQRDMLRTGEKLPPMETITMDQYQQTGLKIYNEDMAAGISDFIVPMALTTVEADK